MSFDNYFCTDTPARRILSQEKRVLATTGVYACPFYFMPIDILQLDTSFDRISTETQLTTFQGIYTGNVSLSKNLTEISSIAEISQILPQFEKNISNSSGYYWIHISDMVLKTKGIVYIAIEQSNITENIPTAQQLKSKKNFKNETFLGLKIMFYNFTILKANFSGLKDDTLYNIYWIGTSENPSQWAYLTKFYNMTIRTPKVPIIKNAHIIKGGIVLCLIFILLIFNI